jgi:hypothetical protein
MLIGTQDVYQPNEFVVSPKDSSPMRRRFVGRSSTKLNQVGNAQRVDNMPVRRRKAKRHVYLPSSGGGQP